MAFCLVDRQMQIINTLKVQKRELMGKVQSLEGVLAELADKEPAEAIAKLIGDVFCG